MRKWIRWMALGLLALGAISHAGEKEVQQAVIKAFSNAPIASIRVSAFDKNWYEVIVAGEVFYVDRLGHYLIAGSVIDLQAKRDITQEKREELSRIDVGALPLNLALKRVQGNGSRVLITFEDPFCGYCKKLNAELRKVKNVTLYTFLYPVISPQSPTVSKQIWCSADRNKAWQSVLAGDMSKLGTATCNNPIEKIVSLGQQHQIRSVPTLIFPDGTMLPGFRTAKDIESLLAAKKPR